MLLCAAKGTLAAAGGAKVTPNDNWAADGQELSKQKSDIPYDAMKAGAGADCSDTADAW
jgi:hypothetical protein